MSFLIEFVVGRPVRADVYTQLAITCSGCGPWNVPVSSACRVAAVAGVLDRPEYSLISSSHLLFFKNSCQTQLCTKFIHIHVDTRKCYGDKLEMTVTIRQL